MPWLEQDIMCLRKQFIEECFLQKESFTSLCLKFKISRVTGYKWINRYKEDGLYGLNNQSKRPHSFRAKTQDKMVDVIIKKRDQFPEWGARKIRQLLLNEGVKKVPSEATLNRILKSHQKIDSEKSKQRTKLIRFEHPNPNDLWQMDFKGHFQTQSGRCHPLTIIDDYSRFSLCLTAFPSEESSFVYQELEKIFYEYGLPNAMTMDNGPQWKKASKLYVWLMKQGIKVSHSRPYHPQTQGKDERFHRTLKEEVLKYRQFKDLEMAQKNFDEWRELYNFVRPHEGIGMQRPFERYSKSLIPYIPVRAIEYNSSDQVRKVRSCGQICYEGKNYFVGEYLSGEYVALREQKEGFLEIYFVNTRIGRINL